MVGEETANLFEWQRNRLEVQRSAVFGVPQSSQVTVVTYHFWDVEQADLRFDSVECALYETWRHCGKLKACVVVNRETPRLRTFAEAQGDAVTIRVNPALIPGDLPSMSVDCIVNLHRYFDTDSVLVIQNDGFPLRGGIKAFEGRYDYIGAPFVRDTALNRIMGLWPRFAVGNGGFSLRTKRICEMASFYWSKRWYHHMPRDWRFVREDAFYGVLLPWLETSYRRTIRFAPVDVALRFSYDDLYGACPAELPFGFHGSAAFREFVEKGLLKQGEQGSAAVSPF